MRRGSLLLVLLRLARFLSRAFRGSFTCHMMRLCPGDEALGLRSYCSNNDDVILTNIDFYTLHKSLIRYVFACGGSYVTQVICKNV